MSAAQFERSELTARLSIVGCPMCLLPHWEFLRAEEGAGWNSERAAPPSLKAPASRDEDILTRVARYSVPTQGISLELLADPAIVALARETRTSPNEIAMSIAEVLMADNPRQGCPHAVLVSGRLCFFLAYSVDDRTVGLASVVELASPGVVGGAVKLPIAKELLESQPTESGLSYQEFMSLEEWTPANCIRFPEPRQWGHWILVSHVWRTRSLPGTEQDLADMKRLVREYVSWQLEENRKSANPRVKAGSAEDFGIWVDYMIVPNDPMHADCPKCAERKAELIGKINGLLTIATVLYANPTQFHRGWILQEMSGNSHVSNQQDVKPLRHRHRARLMAGRVDFSDAKDGATLRCYEFLRLGQSPRTWPAVNVDLLDQLGQRGLTDESAGDAARSILLTFARAFDRPCHDVKRMMCDLAQAVALCSPSSTAPGSGTAAIAASAIRLETFLDAVDAQGQAMRTLATRIDPDRRGDLDHTELEERIGLTRALQIQCFAGVAMGLRAEWMYGDGGAGLGPWIWLSAMAHALAGVKFMARLQAGCVGFAAAASSVVLDDKTTTSLERYAEARRTAAAGVDAQTLAAVYDDLAGA